MVSSQHYTHFVDLTHAQYRIPTLTICHSPLWKWLQPNSVKYDNTGCMPVGNNCVYVKFSHWLVVSSLLTLPAQYAVRGLWNGRASVRLSVPSIDSRSGGFAAERLAGRRYRSIAAAGAQQQMRGGALKTQVLENASTEKASTKQRISQGWKT